MLEAACTMTGHRPQRFAFRYNEQAPLCLAIKNALLTAIETHHQQGILDFYVGGVRVWMPEQGSAFWH